MRTLSLSGGFHEVHAEDPIAPAGLLNTVAAAATPHPRVHTLAAGQVLDKTLFYDKLEI